MRTSLDYRREQWMNKEDTKSDLTGGIHQDKRDESLSGSSQNIIPAAPADGKTYKKRKSKGEEPKHKVARKAQINIEEPERQAFYELLERQHIREFLAMDPCMKISDKYLLAMVQAYFYFAGLDASEYTERNFFLALYLANDMEEDNLSYKRAIFPWALGHSWRHNIRQFLWQKNQFWVRLGFRACVCRRLCDEINVTAQLLTNRGVIHQFMGKLSNAMRDYQAAIQTDPEYALAYFNAANLYLHNRQFPQARTYYSQSVELDPGNESAVLNRGITKMLLQDAQGALEDFQMVMNLCPVSSAAYFNRATLHNTLQQYKQAEGDITQALLLQPEDPLMYKLRADIRGKLGLQREAIEDYERAITLIHKCDK